ncbi:MAG: leucyl aminopeptidase family protein [Leptonema sp. (in: bacteria)]
MSKEKEIVIKKSILHFYPRELKDSSLVLPVFQETTNEEIQTILEKKEEYFREDLFFKKKVGEIYQKENLIFLGLGERKKFHLEILFNAFRSFGANLSLSGPSKITILFPFYLEETLIELANKINKNDPFLLENENKKNSEFYLFDYITSFGLEESLKTMIFALEVGSYSLGIYKTTKNSIKTKIEIGFRINLTQKQTQDISNEAKSIAELINLYRYIASLPGNILNPETYEAFIKKIIKNYKLRIKILQEKDLKKLGMNGVLSVGSGSKTPPRVILLEYHPKNTLNQKPVLLCGKGITFDTGGISLKPAQDMHEMKYDMSGSALTLFSVIIASILKVEYPVIGILGLAENIPDARASRPGDVYYSYNGTSVEIQNTDAEGRLVLGDILSYGIKKYSPKIVMDFATLTGACIIALGHFATGIMCTSDSLYKKIETASYRSLERVWRLPHWSIYDEQLKSDIADLKNIGGRPAGSITAMRFLAKFVPSDIPWAHFDIAGTAWLPNGPEYAKGATGWGIRLMSELFKILNH